MNSGRAPTRPQPLRLSSAARGFSLVEVMFAVIVLGIGLIMIAAVFPVAISQTKTTTEETTAAAIARDGVNYLSLAASNTVMPADVVAPAQVVIFDSVANHGDWTLVAANQIFPTDARFAWVPLYRRDIGSSYAQVFVVAVQSRRAPVFDPNVDITAFNAANPANLQPKQLKATIVDGNPDQITLTTASGATANGGTYSAGASDAVAEGTLVVVSHDNVAGAGAGRMNNRIYRIGNFISSVPGVSSTWELAPGNDFTSDPGPDGISGNGDDILGLTNADVYIIGRSRRDPTTAWNAATNPYEGLTQDVAVYTTFVRVN